MEQLDQLRDMRDAASVRLEEARAAIEASPDAKLVSSLTSLIEDLETSLGMVASSAPVLESTDTKDTNPVEEISQEAEETDPVEMSLEDSLEAELMGENPTS